MRRHALQHRIRGRRLLPGGIVGAMLAGRATLRPLTGAATTLGVVATNASLQKAGATKLAAAVWSDRKIFSSSGGSGLEFTETNFGATVNPDSWTHGSSEQRQRWFAIGLKTGSVSSCNTFSASSL